MGLGPVGAVPSFFMTSRFPTSVAVSTLCTHIIDLTQSDALYVAGIVTFRRGDLAGSALCRPPIFGENILDAENQGRYFCSAQALALDNAERAYVTGVVARNVDGLSSAAAPSLAEDVRRIVYTGTSASLFDSVSSKSAKASAAAAAAAVAAAGAEPGSPSLVVEMHLHALVLKVKSPFYPTERAILSLPRPYPAHI